MAWDSTRPVPWRRLVRDWLVYVAIMTVVLLIVYRDRLTPGLFGGLLVSGPIFVLIGALLAKLGYQRKTMRQLRAEADARAAANAAAVGASSGGSGGSGGGSSRNRPAPTKRTGGGGNRPPQRKRR